MIAKHAIITDACRVNWGDQGALDEALRRLREEYLACAPHWPLGKGTKFHLKLEIERSVPAQPTPTQSVTSEQKCGEFAGDLIAGASWFPCALPKGHALDSAQPFNGHISGGNCTVHGEYIGEQCPRWPNCVKELMAAQSVTSEEKKS